MIRPTVFVLSGVALILSISTTAAAASVTVASVTAGGVNHLVVYPLNDSSKAARVESALPTIITTYEALWKSGNNSIMPFQLLIDTGLEAPTGDSLSDTAFETLKLPVPSAPAEWTGTTESGDTNACHINLYDASPLNAPNALEFELAIDAARCYLLHNISAEQQDWWYEGLSLWMALQVYSPPPTPLATMQKDYRDNYNSDLFNASEEAVYFWEFLLGSNIQNPPFADLPALAQSFGSDSKQFLSLTPDLFYSFAHMVDAEALPWQPAADDIADDSDLSGSTLPADVELDLEQNAIYITNVTLPELEEGKGVTVTGDGLGDTGTMVGIGSAGSFTPIADGVPFDVCGQSDFTVIAGRAVPANVSSEALSGPSLTVSLKDDCAKSKLPPCIVGTWQQDVPYTSSNGYVSLDGSLLHTYNDDGSITQVYSNYVVTFNLPNEDPYYVTYVTTVFSGMMSAEPDPKIKGHYIVTDWHRQMEAGGEVTQTRYGQTNDVTSYITEKYFGDGVPVSFDCDSDDAKNTHWTSHLAGPTTESLGVTDISLTRVP